MTENPNANALVNTYVHAVLFSNNTSSRFFKFRPATTRKKKSNTEKKQKSTKMLVRNIPFQANRKEITELFK